MTQEEVQKVILVSESEDWREAMSVVLETRGAAVASTRAVGCAARVDSFRPTFAVIDVDGGMSLERPSDRLGLAGQTATGLRDQKAALPIILMTSMPVQGLGPLARELGLAEVLLADCLDPAALADQCLAVVQRLLLSSKEPVAPKYATIEITIGQATLRCDINVGGQTVTWGPAEWRSRDAMVDVDREFRRFESSKTEFQALNVPSLGFFGRLVRRTFDEPLKFAQEFCERHLPQNSQIFHRFALRDGDLEYVPFEAIATLNRDEHLRFVFPVARRLVTADVHAKPPHAAPAVNSRQRVLFILSNASGVFEVPNLTFKSEARPTLGQLKYLKDELKSISDLHRGELTPLILEPGDDSVGKIAAAFQSAHFDVVHYAGHSLRADSADRVFLALPGASSRVSIPFDAEDFALLAAQNDVRLVVLSSCEGCSGLALSRMASGGIPAVAGFRWPVSDLDASVFTTKFHEELSKHVPICTAFHSALLDLKRKVPQRLTVFSPVLMMQPPLWHEFALEH